MADHQGFLPVHDAAPQPTAQLDNAQLTALVQQLQHDIAQLQAQHVAAPAAAHAAPPVAARASAVPRAKPPKPPTYKGDREVLSWAFKVERYFDAAGITDDVEKCTFAASLLDGMAANWLRCVMRNAGGTLYVTWNDFKVALVRQFQPLADEDDAQQKLMRLTQRKSVRQYVQIFMDTVLRLPDMHEKDRLFRFKEGLKLPCREWVVRARPTSLLDAMTAAEEWEQIHLGEKSRDNVARFRVREADRGGADPMQLGSAKGSSGKSSPKAHNGQGHKGDSQKRTVRTCFNCGKPGHIAKDCWLKNKGSSKAKVNSTNADGDSESSSDGEN